MRTVRQFSGIAIVRIWADFTPYPDSSVNGVEVTFPGKLQKISEDLIPDPLAWTYWLEPLPRLNSQALLITSPKEPAALQGGKLVVNHHPDVEVKRSY